MHKHNSLLVAACLLMSPLDRASSQDQKLMRDSHWRGAAAVGDTAIEEVTDAAVGADGRIFLADASARVVWVYTPALRLLGSVGRAGSGPGEYRSLVAVRALPDGRIATLDGTLRRIYVYSWNDGQAVLESVVPLEFRASDMCAVSPNRFVLLGRHGEWALHEVDGAGAVIRSGVPLPKNSKPLHTEHIVSGRITCIADARVIALVSSWLPNVDIYYGRNVSELRLARRDSISPSRNLSIRISRSSVEYAAPINGYHSPMRAIPMGQSFVVPARVLSRGDRQPDDTLQVFEFSWGQRGVQRHQSQLGQLFDLSGELVLDVAPGMVLGLKTLRKSRLDSSLEKNSPPRRE